MIRLPFKTYLLLFLFVGCLQFVDAQSAFYYYKQLGVKDGLSQSRVQCILNDHKGYLWIGTESGLNCYDREHLKQYHHRSGDETTLLSNDIIFVAEDSLYNLWVGTSDGICRYNRENDSFVTLQNDGRPVYVASCLSVEGGILFGGSGAIYKYDYATRKLLPLYYANNPDFYTPFWQMVRYDDSHILLNSRWHGIYSFDLNTNELEKVDYFSEQNYTNIYFDSRQRLWVAVYGNGLYCYQKGQLLHHFTTANSPLTYDVIHDMTEKDDRLWIATDGGGINMIDLDNFSFSNLRQTEGDLHSFPTNTIYRLYVDMADNIWAGSIRYGLIGMKKVHARCFQNVPFGNPYGLSNQTVNRFFQDSEGTVWIGTDGGGINSFDLESGTFRHYSSTQGEKVSSVVEYSPSELLFYSFNKGLFVFNKHTGQMRPFILMNPQVNAQMCINGFSVNVQKISDSKILFSAQHIFVYDLTTRQFEIVASMGSDYERNSPLVIATEGDKTYLSDLKNICEYDSSMGTFRTIYRGEHSINDAYLDKDGVFWLATAEGLVRYDPRIERSEQIETNLFQEAMSVVADHQGRIWVGTRRHLYVYSLQTRNFVILDEVDGVLPNEFLFHSALVTSDGDILMGGTEGMTLVKPDIRFVSDTKYTIELLDVLVDGLPVVLPENKDRQLKTVEVPWNFSSLQLKVLLNENDVFRRNMFRFRIKESGLEPVESESNSFVINYLPVGEYTITSSYYTLNGEWAEEQQLFRLVVTPPWWKTGWAYAALCLIILANLYGVIYYFYRKKKIKQRREIRRLKNRLYEEKINFLTNISHELRTPLTLICAPLKRILNHETDEKDIVKQLLPIYKQAYQMKNIIDMVLDVRKLEEGKDMLHILPHSLNEWVRSVGDKFSFEFEAKGINLEYRLDEAIGEVPFDASKCEFVLSNFLMNALKFSEPGTTTTLITTLLPEKDWIRVSVQDEGMGLSMVDMDSLFSNFYQGNHDKGGSGIGLSYAKNLIAYHKGRIGASNAPEHGAIFYFELPLTDAGHAQLSLSTADTPADIEMKEADKDIDYEFLQKFSIMIVEDTVDLRNYLKETLLKYFGHVYVAKDGKEALEQIKQRLPDIIVSDVMMPRMNGFELCRAVKTDLDISHIPFILLTAYHNSQNMHTGYKTGADAFLGKPFEIDSLLALVGNQLRMRENIRTRYQNDSVLSHKEVSFSNADETFLLKLNTLITDNMANPELDVPFLASNMFISRSLLFNKVKAITGMGIIDYVNKLRIDRSVILLTTTDMNLTEISELVGFSSLRYFSKVFKSVKGEIPSTFRKQWMAGVKNNQHQEPDSQS